MKFVIGHSISISNLVLISSNFGGVISSRVDSKESQLLLYFIGRFSSGNSSKRTIKFPKSASTDALSMFTTDV